MSAAVADGSRAGATPAPRRTDTTIAAHVTHEGGRVVITLRGALDDARVPLLEMVLHRLERRGRGRLTLDLRDLDAIDEAGVAMVHRSLERALHSGRAVSVLGDDVTARGASPTTAETK
jgi:anti-anti-sigma regulatory factor